MAEFSNSNTVSVAAGENLPLTETAVKAPACIMHREGSGLVTLRGLTNQCSVCGCVYRGAARLLRDRGTQKHQYPGCQHCKQQSNR